MIFLEFVDQIGGHFDKRKSLKHTESVSKRIMNIEETCDVSPIEKGVSVSM